jgi:hypothetical protein
MAAPFGPPPQGPYYHYQPAKPPRRWLPVAIIAAALIVAAAIIGAVLLSRSPDSATPGSSAPAASGRSPASDGAAPTSSTCKSWPSIKAALDSIPALPAGWNWDTPNIDVYISNQSAAVSKGLDLFEADIAAGDPPEVVATARAYVSERRQAQQKLVDRTFTSADKVPVSVALAKLDDVCGVD